MSYQRPLCTCHILAGNNQETISDCLESVIRPGLFAQILVLLDTRSKDATGAILATYAKHYPSVKVVSWKWRNPPDFSAVRNQAISMTHTPYAYWQDSDEILKKPEQLEAMLSKAHGQAFQMWVISPIHGDQYHNMFQPRLFPVVPGVFFECPVFERLDWSLRRAGVEIEWTGADPIWHPGYTDKETLTAKGKRNFKIMKNYLKEHRVNDVQRQHIHTQCNRVKR